MPVPFSLKTSIMKRFLFPTLTLLAAVALLVTACRKTVDKQSGQTLFESTLTAGDSAQVLQLAETFFSFLQAEDYTNAAVMLYKVDLNDVHAEPQVLDNEELQEVTNALSLFPCYGYRVDYIKFRERFLNEMRCTAYISNPQDGTAPATVAFCFKPVEYLGGWVLCMMNADTGDNPFVSRDERDSLTKLFNPDDEVR